MTMMVSLAMLLLLQLVSFHAVGFAAEVKRTLAHVNWFAQRVSERVTNSSKEREQVSSQ